MITTRFKDVVWASGACIATLSFYMISQSVAAKRAEVASVERSIVKAQQEIRQLKTEIDTRGGLAQIEKWNQSVYGLQAPGAEQFVTSSVRLAALTSPTPAAPLPLDPGIVASHGALSQVAYNRIEDGATGQTSTVKSVASRPAPAAEPIAQPALRQANYVRPSPSALAPQDSPVRTVAVRKPAVPALGDDFIDGLTEEAPATARKARR
jgi:hypothetical protein